MVKHDNQWGTVCDDGILSNEDASKSTRAAQSACHTLGFSGGVIELHNATLVGPSAPTWMDNVDCGSSTTNFLSCSHNGWGKENCNHDEDVVLICD